MDLYNQLCAGTGPWARRVKQLRDSNSLLLQHTLYEVSVDGLDFLLPGVWLNDESINFAVHQLNKRADGVCHFFSSFFMSKLYMDPAARGKAPHVRYQNVKRWTLPSRLLREGHTYSHILDCRVWVAPVNVNNNHWVLLAADLASKCVWVMDPYGVSLCVSNGGRLRNRSSWCFSLFVCSFDFDAPACV
jgi:Ulp1 family protease